MYYSIHMMFISLGMLLYVGRYMHPLIYILAVHDANSSSSKLTSMPKFIFPAAHNLLRGSIWCM